MELVVQKRGRGVRLGGSCHQAREVLRRKALLECMVAYRADMQPIAEQARGGRAIALEHAHREPSLAQAMCQTQASGSGPDDDGRQIVGVHALPPCVQANPLAIWSIARSICRHSALSRGNTGASSAIVCPSSSTMTANTIISAPPSTFARASGSLPPLCATSAAAT